MAENMQNTLHFFSRYKYFIYSFYIESATTFQPVTKVAFSMVMNNFKEKCEGAIQRLISKLDMRFPKQKIMTTLGVVYPQYWVVDLTITKETIFLTLAH
jgi:hypothetical protein